MLEDGGFHEPGAAMKTLAIALLVFLALVAGPAAAQDTAAQRELPAGLVVPPAAQPGPEFDVGRATDAYVALLSPEQRERSNAYFEGGYVLQWVGLAWNLAVAALLLWSGLSRRMRDLARRVTARYWPSTAIYVVLWLSAMFVLTLPWNAYENFFREHAYGLATQTFGAWLADQGTELLVEFVLDATAIATIYLAIRATGRAWWAWAGLVSFAFIVFAAMIAPVYINPLFNTYTPLSAGPLRDSILSQARASRIPADDVYEFDASKQTTRISANVSGMFGTMRISLNDNLLERTSDPEIRAVMGHEMGHYVLNHGLRLTVYLTLLLTLGFLVVSRTLDWAIARWGQRWGVADRSDPAAFPAVFAILGLFFALMTPVSNSIIRQAEAEADAYGLASAREPHGFAMAAMRLSTYRKIHPGPLEEIVFYDHPSGYDRVHRSMSWLAENLDDPHVRAAVAQSRPGVEAAAPTQ
jgi:STE24 endopeptidase